MSLEEELGKIVGQSDQAAAAYATIANSWATFFNQLIKDGMTREEALAVTMAAIAPFFQETFKK